MYLLSPKSMTFMSNATLFAPQRAMLTNVPPAASPKSGLQPSIDRGESIHTWSHRLQPTVNADLDTRGVKADVHPFAFGVVFAHLNNVELLRIYNEMRTEVLCKSTPSFRNLSNHELIKASTFFTLTSETIILSHPLAFKARTTQRPIGPPPRTSTPSPSL